MSGVEQYPVRIPAEWERALPGFTVWFARFLRDVLSKADVRNAIGSGGISITGSPATVATLGSEGFGAAQVFAPRGTASISDVAQSLNELRTFARSVASPVEYADAQTVLAQRIFGG